MRMNEPIFYLKKSCIIGIHLGMNTVMILEASVIGAGAIQMFLTKVGWIINVFPTKQCPGCVNDTANKIVEFLP